MCLTLRARENPFMIITDNFRENVVSYAFSFIPEIRDSRYYLPRGVGITMDYGGQAELYMRRVVNAL